MHLPFFTKQISKSAKRSPSASTSQTPLVETERQQYHENEATARLRIKFWNWILDSWILNYAALSLSFALLASVLFILGYYNGRPLSDWQHPLSLNTVLSIFATVMKGSTMLATTTALSQSKWTWYHTSKRPLQDFRVFDNASRGPLGAAQLLVRLRMWHLASLGAVVTLLALLSDTFVQASAIFPSRISDVGEAWIPISTNYTLGGIQPPVIPTVDGVDPSMKSALYSGVLDANTRTTSSVLIPECSSGNCSFPPYASLAVCSKCTNVTSRLSQQPETPLDYNYDFTFHLLTDAGTDLTLHQNYTSNTQPYSFINTTSVKGSLPFGDFSTMSPSEAIIFSDTSTITANISAASQVYRAFQCTLYLCMRVYDGSVQDGKLLETVSNVVSTGWNPESTGTGTDKELSGFSLGSTLPDGRPARVSVDYLTYESLAEYLGSGVDGSDGSALHDAGPFAGSGSSVDGIEQWTNDIIQGIWVNDPVNVIQSWENIADSMTANMRVQSGNRAVGTAHAPEPYIHTRWVFMLLPAAMVLLALLFVVLTSWRSHVCELPRWGSNALADVIYAGGVGLDISAKSGKEGAAERPETMLRVSELEKWAEGKTAGLRFRMKEEEGWI
jgi:hypothetical protein